MVVSTIISPKLLPNVMHQGVKSSVLLYLKLVVKLMVTYIPRSNPSRHHFPRQSVVKVPSWYVVGVRKEGLVKRSPQNYFSCHIFQPLFLSFLHTLPMYQLSSQGIIIVITSVAVLRSFHLPARIDNDSIVPSNTQQKKGKQKGGWKAFPKMNLEFMQN